MISLLKFLILDMIIGLLVLLVIGQIESKRIRDHSSIKPNSMRPLTFKDFLVTTLCWPIPLIMWIIAVSRDQSIFEYLETTREQLTISYWFEQNDGLSIRMVRFPENGATVVTHLVVPTQGKFATFRAMPTPKCSRFWGYFDSFEDARNSAQADAIWTLACFPGHELQREKMWNDMRTPTLQDIIDRDTPMEQS